MTTIYDWLAIAIFCALAVTFLSRSINRPDFADPPWPYLAFAVGCGLGNWLGNEGHGLAAIAVLAAVAIGYFGCIKPLRR